MAKTKQNQKPLSPIYILHLSDIHIKTSEQSRKYFAQLATDLRQEIKINRLQYLVVSGDIGDHSTSEEYEAAFELIDGLTAVFGLDFSRVIVVPGNHDLNWGLAASAYKYIPKYRMSNPLPEEEKELYIPAGDAGALLRDENLYKLRFANFSDSFYKKISGGESYPTDYAEQALLHLYPEDRILFLGLNSCWQIDHYYCGRAGINSGASSVAIKQIMAGNFDGWVKIAVWHHPITGKVDVMSDEFLQMLAVHGFQIGMHGHIHEAIEGYHWYDRNRRIRIIGAGTFGAPAKEQVTGIPLQYNLLVFDPMTRTMVVNTRKKEKPDGAWSADARWGSKNKPVPWYRFKLK